MVVNSWPSMIVLTCYDFLIAVMVSDYLASFNWDWLLLLFPEYSKSKLYL